MELLRAREWEVAGVKYVVAPPGMTVGEVIAATLRVSRGDAALAGALYFSVRKNAVGMRAEPETVRT